MSEPLEELKQKLDTHVQSFNKFAYEQKTSNGRMEEGLARINGTVGRHDEWIRKKELVDAEERGRLSVKAKEWDTGDVIITKGQIALFGAVGAVALAAAALVMQRL